MRGAEFIGLDALNENLKDFRFDAIAVLAGKYEKFKRIAMEDESEDDLIDGFNVWANRMIASNPNNASVYAIQLYEMPEGGKKLQGTSSFTFKLTDKAFQTVPSEKNIAGNFDKKEFDRILQLELDKQQLQFDNQMLQNQLMEQDSDEDEEEESVGMIGAVQDAVISRLPQLMDMMIMQFTKPTSQPMVGIGGSIDELISEFRTINPDIESDLQRLLNLAKTKPDLFKVLIGQLRLM